jgi:hypothetical protein
VNSKTTWNYFPLSLKLKRAKISAKSFEINFCFVFFNFSQSEDEVEKRRVRYRENSEKSFDEKKVDFFGRKKSSGTQTDFREIDVQTDPCTISYETDEVIRRKPEVTSLAMLKHGRGLPVKTTDDLVRLIIRHNFFQV